MCVANFFTNTPPMTFLTPLKYESGPKMEFASWGNWAREAEISRERNITGMCNLILSS